jgi:predicted phage tail protein
MLRRVHLHGHLGERHGRLLELDVDSPAEAIRALCHTRPGFRDDLREGFYRVQRGDDPLEMSELGIGMGRQRDIHIVPQPVVAGIELAVIGWMLVGAVVVAAVALAFMPTIKPPDAKNRENNDTNFLFDGPVNVTEQGHPVPLVFGRWRCGSVVVSSGVETTDIPAAALPTGTTATGGFLGTVIDNSVFGKLIHLGKGGKGGGSARAAQEDPNTLQSQATARVIDLISEGEIVGLADGLKSVYFDDTPVENSDGTFNFHGVAIEHREGTSDQAYMPGHTDQSNAREINRPINTTVGPATETISDATVNRARVTLGLNSLFYQDPSNGDMKRTTVEVKIELQSNGGGYSTKVSHIFDGKTTSKYQKSFDLELPAAGNPWDIRVTRVTADRESANYQDDITWDILTEITDAKLIYPDSAVVGLTVDAKQFGNKIPVRSYDIKGLIVDVPTNFDPVANTYATTGPGTSGGTWDGTFKSAWTDEPVWCFRELCINARWGLGRRLGVGNIDKWTLYTIAQRNNGAVPDGAGGFQRRHVFNACITSREQAYNVLSAMAATFRSVVYWSNNQVALAQDAPADASRLVVPANTIDGEVNYETPDIEEKASAYIVAWNDPTDSYRLAYEVVEDKALRQVIGWKTKDVSAYGETRRAGAVRHGKWLLEDQKNDERVTWRAGFDQADLIPQQVVAVADPEVSGQEWGGRVLAATTTSATLDRQVTLVAGRTYTLMIILLDGTVAERVVTTAAGTVSSVAWSSPLGSTPIAGAVWALKSDLLEPSQWRVQGREEEDALTFALSAVAHDPDKYDRVELGLVLEAIQASSLPTGALTPPTNLAIYEFIKLIGDVGVPSVLISWSASTDIRVVAYQVQVRRPESSTFEFVPWDGGLSVDLFNIVEGEHIILVRGLDALGRASAWVMLDQTFDGLPPAPDAPTDFFAYPGVDGVRFIWTPVTTSGSVLDYEIRRGASWEAGQYICRVESDTTTVKLPTSASIDAEFWLAARVKGTSLYSTAVYATTYQANVPNVNVVLTSDFAGDSWAGGVLRRLTSVTLDAAPALLLSSDTDGQNYPWGDYRDSVDLGATYYVRSWLETTVRNTVTSGVTWDSLTGSWDSLGGMTWSPADGPLTDIALHPYIAVDSPDSNAIEAWKLGADNIGDIASTAPTISILVTAHSGTGVSLHGYAATLGNTSLLGFEDDVPFPGDGTFCLGFNYTPDAVPSEDRVLLTVTDGTHYLQLQYDVDTHTLILTDGTHSLTCTAPTWSTTETYRFAIGQTLTDRYVCWVANDAADEGAYATTAQAPNGPFDTLYLGSAGPGAYETWADAGYTWADTAAGRTWAELFEVLFPCAGDYSDMLLSSDELTATNYTATLLLRGPAGYSSYRPLIPGDYNFRRAWVWQRLAAPVGVGQNIYLTASKLITDVPDILDGGSASVAGTGSTVINFNAAYHAAPRVTAVVVGGSVPAVVDIVSVVAGSFTVRLWNLSGAQVSGVINWGSRGY